jgi:hypothetical protein
MADTALILGLAGVVGTITGTAIGAIIGARSTAAMEQRREARHHREGEERLQAAARLVWLDLATADGNLSWAALRKRWHPAGVRLPSDAWERERGRLSIGIADSAAWETVATTMAALNHIKELSAATWTGQSELSSEAVDSINDVRRLISWPPRFCDL